MFAPLVLAGCALVAALLPGSAAAFPSAFTLQTGPALFVGSGVALAGNAGMYPPGTVFLPVEVTPVEGGLAAEVGSFFMPEIELAFGGDVFSFELLEQGVPTDTLTLAIATPAGDINPGLGDPPLEVRMTRTFDGVPAGTGTFAVPLTTGQVQIPQCGTSPPTSISGSPLDVATGEVDLVGGTCIQNFAGQPFGAVFRIRLVGTLPVTPPAPVPALSPLGLLALAVATLFAGVSRLRARS